MPEDLDNLDEDQSTGPKQLRDALDREKQRAAAAEAELTQLRRDAAFRDAGVDLTNPLHAAAARGYDGNLEGITDWAHNLGLTHSESAPQVPDQERLTLERIASASGGDGGSAPAPQAETDKNRELQGIYDQARREGWTTNRFQDEMRNVVAKYGGPIQSMPYTVIPQEQQSPIQRQAGPVIREG